MRQGFMRHERLSLYNALINDEVRKHIKIWCQEDKVDLFKSVSQLVTSINIRCVLGDDAYHAHAEEIASIYYQLELSGTTSHCAVLCACRVASLVVSRVAGIFGEAGHVDYSSSKSALMYGFMRTLKNGNDLPSLKLRLS